MALLNDVAETILHLSGFVVIGADFFLPFDLMSKGVMLLIGALLIHMVWIK